METFSKSVPGPHIDKTYHDPFIWHIPAWVVQYFSKLNKTNFASWILLYVVTYVDNGINYTNFSCEISDVMK